MEEAEKYSSHLKTVKWCQQLFLLSSGHLGMGPVSSVSKDEVWIIAGCTFPMVLRPSKTSKGSFTVLGRTYVHGIMDGEIEAHDTAVQTILLG